MLKTPLIVLGKNVRQIRLDNKLSQEKLAEITGLHRTYIGGIERGERNVSVLNLVKISKALDIPLSQLLDGVDTS